MKQQQYSLVWFQRKRCNAVNNNNSRVEVGEEADRETAEEDEAEAERKRFISVDVP